MTDENRLAERLKGGEATALEQVIDTYSAYVLTVIRNFSRGIFSEQDIEELAADVFVRLWNARDGLIPERGLRAYLAAVARNRVKNALRSVRDITVVDIDDIELASDIDLYRGEELSQMLSCLYDGLETLRPREREIFIRFYFYGEKTSAIARVVGCPDPTVRSMLSRTRAALKKYLTERGFDHV